MEGVSVQQRFTDAIDALVEQIKEDRSILAALLCGSLSHDTVWARSDVDLVLITIDDRKIPSGGTSLFADGVNVHALLMPRAEFRKTVESSLQSSFSHSFLAKGRLLYTHDETIAALHARLGELGARDTEMQLFRAATHLLPLLYKAHKWFVTRDDLDYTALWILYAAEPLARLEVISAGLIADREVIPQAARLNPELFRVVYSGMLNAKKTRAAVRSALQTIDDYLAERAPRLFAPLLEHLRDVGEARSCTELEHHFKRHYDVGHVSTACEYLADLGLIGKAGVSARLTKRSTVDVQELAFFHIAS